MRPGERPEDVLSLRVLRRGDPRRRGRLADRILRMCHHPDLRVGLLAM